MGVKYFLLTFFGIKPFPFATTPSLLTVAKQRGHPLKGESREKTPLHDKKVPPFCLALSPAPAQPRFHPFSHPVLLSYWFWSLTDPHQSPIGINAPEAHKGYCCA